MMTREDMMRELELLPVWQLRAPLLVKEAVVEPVQTKTTVSTAETIVDLVVEQGSVEVVSVSELKVAVKPTSTPQELTYISSDDANWLFILPSSVMSNEEQQLFQNICKAIRIKAKPAEVSADALTFISNLHPKLLLAMGEVPTQALLQSVESIDVLRGNKHQLHDVSLIVTYDLAYLLQNPVDKAKVWSDLCMGLQILQDLKVANTQSD